MQHKAQVVAYHPLLHEFYHLTLHCPILAACALPGQYIYYQHTQLYVLAASQERLEFILPPKLARDFSINTSIILSKPQGQPLKSAQAGIFYLMLLQDQELSAGLFYLKKYRAQFSGLVLIGTEQYFPFQPCPAQKIIPTLPSQVIATLPLLEEWGIANRLASKQEQPGIFHGTIYDLKDYFLQHTQKLKPYPPIELLTLEKLTFC